MNQLVLKKGREKSLKRRHPWIFSGAVEKAAVVVDDAIAIRSVCYLSLTFDHRLVDGALADQFTAKVKAVLENWSEEVL